MCQCEFQISDHFGLSAGRKRGLILIDFIISTVLDNIEIDIKLEAGIWLKFTNNRREQRNRTVLRILLHCNVVANLRVSTNKYRVSPPWNPPLYSQFISLCALHLTYNINRFEDFSELDRIRDSIEVNQVHQVKKKNLAQCTLLTCF